MKSPLPIGPFFRKIASAVMLLSCLVVLGCDREIPYNQYFTDLVHNRSKDFDALEELFRKSGFIEVCHGATAGDIIASRIGRDAAPLRSPEAAELRRRLETTDMYCIFLLEGGAVGLEPYYESNAGDKRYKIRITRGGKAASAEECSEVDLTSNKGYCVTILGDEWTIEYSWMPLEK